MFGENLSDAILSIVELFFARSPLDFSLAMEGSVFLLVKNHGRSLHKEQSTQMESLFFHLGYLI